MSSDFRTLRKVVCFLSVCGLIGVAVWVGISKKGFVASKPASPSVQLESILATLHDEAVHPLGTVQGLTDRELKKLIGSDGKSALKLLVTEADAELRARYEQSYYIDTSLPLVSYLYRYYPRTKKLSGENGTVIHLTDLAEALRGE